jgi:hypothetical protein
MKDALVARTDLAALPELGLALLGDLREVTIAGRVACGSSDPALTGKAAAWLFPLAAVLSPFGTLDVALDWTGKDVLDAEVEGSFRVVLARARSRAARSRTRPPVSRARSEQVASCRSSPSR